jgi:hypothetical protein
MSLRTRASRSSSFCCSASLALPLPTGGATHVFEIIAALLAPELIAGRKQVWLPERWRKFELAGERQQRFINGLMKMIRRLERFSSPDPAWHSCCIGASATSCSDRW